MYGRESTYICPMAPKDILSYITFRSIDEHAETLILNEDHPFIKWLIDFSNSLKDWDNKTLALEKGIIGLFKHHFAETIFSRYGCDIQKLNALKSYLEKLESMPEFPNIEKAPIDNMIESWRKDNELRFRQKYKFE
jgi:hypothetical protein